MTFKSLRASLFRWGVLGLTLPLSLVNVGQAKVLNHKNKAHRNKRSSHERSVSPERSQTAQLREAMINSLPSMMEEDAVKADTPTTKRSLHDSMIADLPDLLSPSQENDLNSDGDSSITSELHDFVATAYSIKNVTASGMMARSGMIAADTKVLPLGSLVKIREAGKYSGIYQVLDTGSSIHGNRLDIYMPSRNEALTFGRRTVQLEIVRYGWGNSHPQVNG